MSAMIHSSFVVVATAILVTACASPEPEDKKAPSASQDMKEGKGAKETSGSAEKNASKDKGSNVNDGPAAGARCGGPDRIRCPDGQSCLSEPAKEGEPTPFGKCTKDDGPPVEDNVEEEVKRPQCAGRQNVRCPARYNCVVPTDVRDALGECYFEDEPMPGG